jgi:hypothetical protein
MDAVAEVHLKNLWSSDKQVQNDAYSAMIELSTKPVDWAYEVWDEMVASLSHKDNHRRAISSQILCNLAKSDPEKRILRDFDKLLHVTRDERFVTARHCMQNLWKIGLAGEEQKQRLIDGLSFRFAECINEKNCTLIRYDIIEDFRKLYDAKPDERLRKKVLELIATEEDTKYQKKYAALWKN